MTIKIIPIIWKICRYLSHVFWLQTDLMASSIMEESSNNCTETMVHHDSVDSKDEGDAFGYRKGNSAPDDSTIQTAPTARYASYYNMNHAKRGLAIIFNHEFFTICGADPRAGTNVDCDQLVNTLKNLSFDVVDIHNACHEDIVKNLEHYASLDHSNHDCIVIAVLSHGDLGTIYAHDTPYKADMIWSYFTADKCPTLAGKPKMFFIQACQGDRLDSGVSLRERTETDGQPAETFRIPNHADFLIVYSTIPGFYSWRNMTRGSWFMQALCMELAENATRYDILTLLTFVSRRVALDFESNTPDKETTHQQKQIPCTTSMLTRLVKFPPKTDQILAQI